MTKGLIRLFSFFAKEVNEVRRQPRLVLSLIFGPFLILMLFGAGYQGDQPNLQTILVAPENSLSDADLKTLENSMLLNFKLVGVERTPEPALARLQRGEVDIVQILPDDMQERALRGEQPAVQFKYNDINPLNEQWIQYLSYAQVNEINRAILQRSAVVMQQEAGEANTELAEARVQLDQLKSGLSSVERNRAEQSLRQVRQAVGLLALNPLLASQLLDNENNPNQARAELTEMQNDLDTLEQAVRSGELDQQRDRIDRMRERIAELEQVTQRLSAVPPEALVSPLKYETQNLSGMSYDLMTFYVPRVLALLVQHIAVTLGALALVRERLLGAIELFRVAPVTSIQVVFGKYLGYTLFIGIIAAVLTALMPLIGVALPGDILSYIGVLLLLTLASIGIGFFISIISTSDSQAIQISMLVLLFSIFFSGFFLPLENFWAPVRALSTALPLTHGIVGLQAVMLQHVAVPYDTWMWLALLAGVLLIVVTISTRYQFRRV